MSKTYMMGDGSSSEEEKQMSREFTERQEQEMREVTQQHIEQEAIKLKVTLEQLLQTKISPEEDRVVVWKDQVASVTDTGIIKPEEVVKREEQSVSMGTVLVVGPGKKSQAGLTNRLLMSILIYQQPHSDLAVAHSLTCKALQEDIEHFDKITLMPGDRIIFGRYAGTPVPDPVTKEEVLILRPGDIFGKILS